MKMDIDRLSGSKLRIGIIDTGVNPWNSRVNGPVSGCRFSLNKQGEIVEDDDFRDQVGHGTDVAAILLEGVPDAEIFAVRVFDDDFNTYPSLVARGILRAASEGCTIVNLSLAMEPGAGSEVLVEACSAAQQVGCILVAASHAQRKDLLPASLPGVVGVIADDLLAPGQVRMDAENHYRYAASGWARDPKILPPTNVWGPSFACARVAVHVAAELKNPGNELPPTLILE